MQVLFDKNVTLLFRKHCVFDDDGLGYCVEKSGLTGETGHTRSPNRAVHMQVQNYLLAPVPSKKGRSFLRGQFE